MPFKSFAELTTDEERMHYFRLLKLYGQPNVPGVPPVTIPEHELLPLSKHGKECPPGRS